MIRLSERLALIASKIAPGEVAADIGTDHGQLPMYLYEQGISPRVILADISQASLAKARETAGEAQLGDRVSFRVGDGLQVLRPGEADAVIIAGVGGRLICEMLSYDPAHTATFPKLILQPRTSVGDVRRWLILSGYWIVSEDIVRERHFLPEIITAVRPQAVTPVADADASLCGMDLAAADRAWMRDVPVGDIRWKVPPWILSAGGKLDAYLDLRIGQEQLALENMGKARIRDREAESRVQENLTYLRGLQETRERR